MTWGVTTDLPVAATTVRGKCKFETVTGESRRKYWLSGRASHPQRRNVLDSDAPSPDLGERCFKGVVSSHFQALGRQPQSLSMHLRLSIRLPSARHNRHTQAVQVFR